MTNLIERMAARLGECEDALSRVRREASGAEQAIQRAQTALGDIERHWRAESPAPRVEEGKVEFPRAPRDDAEREACRMSDGEDQCVATAPAALPVRRCWRDAGHEGDHVAAGYGINGVEVLARWPSSPAKPRELTEAPTLLDELRAMSAAWLETEQACERIRDTAGAFAWARARGGIEALIAKHSGGGK